MSPTTPPEDPKDPSTWRHAQVAAPPEPERWTRVWIATGVLVVLSVVAAGAAASSEPAGSGCRESEGWGYYWLLFTPLVALAAALVLALVADASVNWRAWRGSFGTGQLVGSAVVISWGVGYGLGVALEAACVISNPIWAAETLVLPAVIGVGIVLLAIAWRRGRREVVSGGR